MRIPIRHASRRPQGLGKLLSNTSIMYPDAWDNLGKLRIIPDRSRILECSYTERYVTSGSVGGGLGRWRCKGPPSRRSVRAMKVVALRGKLRHSSQPYGVQQLGKLRNARKCDEGILSAYV